jgi:hypothetical protein
MKAVLALATLGLAAAAIVTTIALGSSSSSAAGPLGDWEMVRSATSRYQASNQKSVLCPPGKRPLGGGYHIVGGGQAVGFGREGFYVHITRPTNNNDGWFVGWYADLGVERFYVQVYALCAKV